MMELNSSINIVSVLVASVASFILGWLWYGPFFGKTWAAENKGMVRKGASMGSAMFKHFILVFITVLSLEMLFTGTLANSLAWIFVLWIGFIVTNRLGSLIWMKGSSTSAIIDIAYHLVNLIVIIAFLSWL